MKDARHAIWFIPAVNVESKRFQAKYKHRNIGHRTNVDELLHSVFDVPLLDGEMEEALHRVAYQVDN